MLHILREPLLGGAIAERTNAPAFRVLEQAGVTCLREGEGGTSRWHRYQRRA